MTVNDDLKCALIRLMLRNASKLRAFWTETGPTREACDCIDNKHGELGAMSHGEAVLLRTAFDLWNGKGHATVDDLVSVLDDHNLAAALVAIAASRELGPEVRALLS